MTAIRTTVVTIAPCSYELLLIQLARGFQRGFPAEWTRLDDCLTRRGHAEDTPRVVLAVLRILAPMFDSSVSGVVERSMVQMSERSCVGSSAQA